MRRTRLRRAAGREHLGMAGDHESDRRGWRCPCASALTPEARRWEQFPLRPQKAP
jgi:hypothetical protein